jgi:hypothetical protein
MRQLLLAVLGIVTLTGCASVERPTLANRFVKHGKPTVDLGGPRLNDRRAPAPPPPPLAGKTIVPNVSRTSDGLSSFEGFDSRLRDALGRVAVAPTQAHHLQVARAYRSAGILDKAYDYLTRSLTVNGPDAVVFDERARLWRDWGTPELGLADAHRAVHLSPDSAALHNTLGTILYRLGQRDEAEVRFQHALALDANAWYALANLCHLNFARGRTRDAITQCRQATAVRDKQAKSKR